MLIGLQFAMPAELHALPGSTDWPPFERVSGVDFYRVVPNMNLLACAGGVGKVNAAMTAEILCQRYQVDMILNAGVAGCMTDLPTGTLVAATEFVQHDVDTTAVGDTIGLVSTVNQTVFPTWEPERLRQMLDNLGISAQSGRVASGDWFATGGQRAQWIHDTFQPLLVDMEGCAIAQVCLRNQIPFVSLKSISDHLFSSNQTNEYFNYSQALQSLGKVTLTLARALLNI